MWYVMLGNVWSVVEGRMEEKRCFKDLQVKNGIEQSGGNELQVFLQAPSSL